MFRVTSMKAAHQGQLMSMSFALGVVILVEARRDRLSPRYHRGHRPSLYWMRRHHLHSHQHRPFPLQDHNPEDRLENRVKKIRAEDCDVALKEGRKSLIDAFPHEWTALHLTCRGCAHPRSQGILIQFQSSNGTMPDLTMVPKGPFRTVFWFDIRVLRHEYDAFVGLHPGIAFIVVLL